MKGFINFCKSNRVFVVLMGIVLICFVVIGICLVDYFYKGKDDNPYGSRTEGIEEVEITDSRISEIVSKIETDEKVKKATMRIQGKVVYIRIEFNPEETLLEAEGKASEILNDFSEEEKEFYDFHFTLKQEKSGENNGFIISGAKNVSGTTLKWNNNNEPDDQLNQ